MHRWAPDPYAAPKVPLKTAHFGLYCCAGIITSCDSVGEYSFSIWSIDDIVEGTISLICARKLIGVLPLKSSLKIKRMFL